MSLAPPTKKPRVEKNINLPFNVSGGSQLVEEYPLTDGTQVIDSDYPDFETQPDAQFQASKGSQLVEPQVSAIDMEDALKVHLKDFKKNVDMTSKDFEKSVQQDLEESEKTGVSSLIEKGFEKDVDEENAYELDRLKQQIAEHEKIESKLPFTATGLLEQSAQDVEQGIKMKSYPTVDGVDLKNVLKKVKISSEGSQDILSVMMTGP